MPQLAVTALGPDRPGVVARLSGLLAEARADVGDVMATVLSGHAVIAMLVDAPEAVDPQVLEQDLTAETADLALAVSVRTPPPGSPSPPATHVLCVHAPDRLGLVRDVTAFLADRGINVTDLAARPVRGQEPVYALQLEIAAGQPGDADELLSALRSQVHDVTAHVEPLDVATF